MQSPLDILRDYQVECINSTLDAFGRGENALCVAPTGSGKSLAFVGLTYKAFQLKPDMRVLVLMNKISLVQQTHKVFSQFFDKSMIGIYCASLKRKEMHLPITIGSVQSLSGIDKMGKVNMIICDEIHRVNDEDKDSHFMKVINNLKKKNSRLRLVGFSATPFRNNGYIYGKDRLFEKVTWSKDLLWAIENNWLVKPIIQNTKEAAWSREDLKGVKVVAGDYSAGDLSKMLATKKDKVEKQVEDAVKRLSSKDRKKCVWICINIEHCEQVCDLIKKNGDSCVVIHSKLTLEQRDANMKLFEDGDVKHLSFVTIISEGIDIPKIDSVVFCRPTKSSNLWVQTVGRALRPYPGKENCLVLDYARVIENCGPLNDPKIKERGKRSTKEDEDIVQFKLRLCKACGTYNDLDATECIVCGVEMKTEKDVFKNLVYKPEREKKILLTKEDKQRIELNKQKDLEKQKASTRKIVDICNVKIRDHLSKNGNPCAMILYEPVDLSTYIIKEYLILPTRGNNAFSWVLPATDKRFIELGLSGYRLPGWVLPAKPVRIPTSIEIWTEGEYTKVGEIYFDESKRKTHRDGDSTLDEQQGRLFRNEN